MIGLLDTARSTHYLWGAWLFLALTRCAAASEISISTDFPGGSGEVVNIDQTSRLVQLLPTAHPDRGWVCWWYVRIDGLTPGEIIQLDVGEAPWATPDRAAVSDDNSTWKQTNIGERIGKRILYKHEATARSMWFAWGPPLVQSDVEALVKRIAKVCPQAEAIKLCQSRDDRPIWAIRFVPTKKPDEKEHRYGIWIQARQHAWESGSSWVALGLTEWLASDDDRAVRLRNIATITVVPIMDVDNVERGAGGKNEVPQDHNRDWTDKPHHPAVSAAQKQILELNAANTFDLFFDLHNPGANSRDPFFYATPRKLLSERGGRNLEHFLAAARADMTGRLAFKGEVQESGENYDKKWQSIAKNWVTFHTAEHVVSATLETAWNTTDSTSEGYRCVGKNLGLAIERYLRASPR
jgi:hypothetical protein